MASASSSRDVKCWRILVDKPDWPLCWDSLALMRRFQVLRHIIRIFLFIRYYGDSEKKSSLRWHFSSSTAMKLLLETILAALGNVWSRFGTLSQRLQNEATFINFWLKQNGISQIFRVISLDFGLSWKYRTLLSRQNNLLNHYDKKVSTNSGMQGRLLL